MAEHRGSPPRAAKAHPLWFIAGSAIAVFLGAGWLVYAVWDDFGVAESIPQARVQSDSTPSMEPSRPSEAEGPEPVPEPKESPQAVEHTPAREPRSTEVFVFNNSRISGLAAAASSKARSAGWNVAGFGNWRGRIQRSTVYHPVGLEDEAALLAADLGIGAIQPRFGSMRSDRLTVIVTAAD